MRCEVKRFVLCALVALAAIGAATTAEAMAASPPGTGAPAILVSADLAESPPTGAVPSGDLVQTVVSDAVPDPAASPALPPPVAPTPTVEPSPTVEPTPTVTPKPPAYPTWMKRYWGLRVNRIRTSRRVVALTFDDGPNSRTDNFVRVLDKYGAKGTFFVTGYRSKARGMAAMNRYVLSHGHELANHTMHHEQLNRSYSANVREITQLEKLLISQTGRRTRWVRAMGGGINSTGLRATRDTKHLYAQWSVDSYDSHQRWMPPGMVYRNVIRSTRSGSIVLLHVTHYESLTALPMICRELKSRGYKMVTLSEMAEMGRP